MLAKYYDGKVKADQLKYEAILHKKSKTMSSKADTEVILIEGELVVCKSGSDCKFFIAGPIDENDMILVSVLDVIYDTISTVLKGTVETKAMLESLELILLTIDEVIDHGYIMEIDSAAVASRVQMKASETPVQAQSLGDLSISQALGLAREQFMRSLGTRTGSY